MPHRRPFLALLLGLAAGAPAGAQEPLPLPFEFELPAGYGAFEAVEVASGEVYRAVREGDDAQFKVERYELDQLGARASLVAQTRAQRFWPQLLEAQGVRSKVIQPWSGAWAGGEEAAGNTVHYRRDDRELAVTERILIRGRNLLLATWEGPRNELEAAGAALASFQPPASWREDERTEHDDARGLGPSAEVRAARGSYELLVDLSGEQLQTVEVELTWRAFDPETARPGSVLTWRVPRSCEVKVDWNQKSGPEGETAPRITLLGEDRCTIEADETGAHRLLYRLPIENDSQRAAAYGLYGGGGADCLALLDPAWIAVPELEEPSPEAYREPPAWQLRLRVPSHMSGLSWAAPESEVLAGDSKSLLVRFPAMPRARSWPYALVGRYREVRGLHRDHLVRLSTKATNPEEPLRELERLGSVLREWLPSAPVDWRVITFPGASDRSLPGALVLDERNSWLDASLDQQAQGVSLRTGLIRRLTGLPFSARLRGVGSAAPWLSMSLGEYAAWRVLEEAGRGAEARALRRAWDDHEQALGDELLEPLSSLGWGDLVGPRWLLCRGPRVWHAIELRAGRDVLDALLDERLAKGGTWTTEDLRHDLETRTGEDWMEWFDAHLYGRAAPELPPLSDSVQSD